MEQIVFVLPDGTEQRVPGDSAEGLAVLRHSAAHVLAQAVRRLYPQVKLGIGPAIENGFYYDFDLAETLSLEDLARIEQEMQNIVDEDLPIVRQELSPLEAQEMFSREGQVYKLELLQDLDQPSIYRQGEFVDLCRGPHLPSTGHLKAFKLLSVAGAYWRGDASRPMLQRIYGTAFPTDGQLQEHLALVEEAKKRDHRRIGRQLDLFSVQDDGPGFPFFHPKGMIVRNALEDFWRREHRRRGYDEVKTPIILREELWHRSGHWEHYRENMYFTDIDQESYAIKPMNCPGGMILYQRKLHSYRDFPVRMAEMGLVHRHELSGTLHGLMRVRCFTQDDAHVFMLPDQIESEIGGVIDFIDYVYTQVFGLKYRVELSTKPEKAMGDDAIWEMATGALRRALEGKKVNFQVNEGDGAFYGPKIDFHLEDCLGRTWQCGTIQLDFLLPERFDLGYIGEDGERHRPVMLHRVIFGALERFITILTEHFAGAFPTWLAPIQVQVIPVSDQFISYAQDVAGQLEEANLRTAVDQRAEKLGKKIREAQVQQIPYMLIVGEKEQASGNVAVRHRRKGDLGSLALAKFREQIVSEVKNLRLD